MAALPQLDQIRALPHTMQMTIPESFRDEMGHMNIQYYIHVYDRAAWGMFDWLGITLERLQSQNEGMFALKQFIQYLAEVHVGETVQVYSRLLGMSERRLHFMHFMINDTTDRLSSTFEVLASYMDLSIRRTAPFPPDLTETIQQHLAQHSQIDWEAPICGILNA